MYQNPTEQVYETIGVGYASARRADPRIESLIWAALGGARTVVNVGAGTGNYEPTDRWVVAVEPAVTMLDQRRVSTVPVVRAVAEALPFRDHAFDAALATFTLHHWNDCSAGLSEMQRVARRQVILLNEPAIGRYFWLVDYFPEALLLASEVRAPSIADIQTHLGVQSVTPVPIPADCIDGFLVCYWQRPEAYLSPSVRAGISSLAQLSPEVQERGVERLTHDLRSGAWDARYGHLRGLHEYDLGYRLVVAG